MVEGTAMAGWSGLKRVEYWLRPATGGELKLAEDDPAWNTATWRPCTLMAPPGRLGLAASIGNFRERSLGL